MVWPSTTDFDGRTNEENATGGKVDGSSSLFVLQGYIKKNELLLSYSELDYEQAVDSCSY